MIGDDVQGGNDCMYVPICQSLSFSFQTELGIVSLPERYGGN